MKIALCILARNERECLELILPRIPKPSAEVGFQNIYAIDGGSTDGTVELLEKWGIPIIGQSRRGRGQAFLEAFDKIDADAFIFFSPDGNEDVRDLAKFKVLLEQGNQLVIASRMMKGAVNEEDHQWLKWRKWANNAFNLLVNFFFRKQGPFVTDSINGYRAITRLAARELNLTAHDYTIEYQMTIRAFKKRLKIAEFPTIEGHRLAGETGAHSFITGIRFSRRLFSEIWI